MTEEQLENELDLGDVTAVERGCLKPYAAHAAATRGRNFDEPEDPWRTVFQRDRDRIIHTTAFRRLENKTQVFVSRTGDHYRTRLTHSLEVAQVSRSIARILSLNEDLTEAVALAHDLGHAPFGHSGGDVLDKLMKDEGGFDHNYQSLRILEHLEVRYPDFVGLNLTYEVRESIVKHNRPFTNAVFDPYHREEGALLEAQLVDLCDGIAYNSHDVDDGLSSGILVESELAELEIWQVVSVRVRDRWPAISDRLHRKKVVSGIIDHLIRDLVISSLSEIKARGIQTVDDVRAQQTDTLGFSKPVRRQERELRRFLFSHFYTHYKVHRMRNRARIFITGLFGEFTNNPKLLPPRFQDRAEAGGVSRAVADYIAGMTDPYAEREYQRLFNPFEGV